MEAVSSGKRWGVPPLSYSTSISISRLGMWMVYDDQDHGQPGQDLVYARARPYKAQVTRSVTIQPHNRYNPYTNGPQGRL